MSKEEKFYKIINDNSLNMLNHIEKGSIDVIICDPPYELNFMNKSWDRTGIAFNTEIWSKCLQVLKDGGYLLAFGGSRTFHRIACAIEDAGFEIRDNIMWLYGCYSDDTQVLTDKGWKYFYELDRTEKVLQWDKDNNKLSWVKPLNYFEYKCTGEEDMILKIKTKNSEQLVTATHRVYCRQNGKVRETIAYLIWAEDNVELPIYNNGKVEWEKVISSECVENKGNVYCLQTETGAFVVRRNGKPFISGNSGFPKSQNIAKSIESKLENGSANTKDFKLLDGTKVPSGNWGINKSAFEYGARPSNYSEDKHLRVDKVNFKHDESKQWAGWGTCLKPAYEPIIVARKPIKGTLVDNVIKNRIGAMNIDECRVPAQDQSEFEKNWTNRKSDAGFYGGENGGIFGGGRLDKDKVADYTPQGRFPANVILTYDENDKEEVISGFPNNKGNGGARSDKDGIKKENLFKGYKAITTQNDAWGDSGSASRYFYCAKASKRDRDEGLDEFEEYQLKDGTPNEMIEKILKSLTR